VHFPEQFPAHRKSLRKLQFPEQFPARRKTLQHSHFGAVTGAPGIAPEIARSGAILGAIPGALGIAPESAIS